MRAAEHVEQPAKKPAKVVRRQLCSATQWKEAKRKKKKTNEKGKVERPGTSRKKNE
jgi:hypothetical protein